MIDARAAVDSSAQIADGVSIGPFSVIGPDVEIGAGTWIGPHVVVTGPTRIGRDNRIFQFASVGAEPQDKKFRGERTRLEIGDGNTIRECVTINRGTAQGGGVTQLGNDNWIMAYCHIAHDCQVGSHTIFANNASLAGHVLVEDDVILGGYSLVHQFSRLGARCFLAFGAHVDPDVPPFVIAAGQRAVPRGINLEGLRRQGAEPAIMSALKAAYRTLYRSGLRVDEALKRLERPDAPAAVQEFTAFVRASRRGIIR